MMSSVVIQGGEFSLYHAILVGWVRPSGRNPTSIGLCGGGLRSGGAVCFKLITIALIMILCEKSNRMLNALYHYLDIRLSRFLKRPPRTLPIILLWITDRCNLRCRMCGDQWRADQQMLRHSLSLVQIQGIVQAAVRLRTMIISITGGEPLLHPEIYQILDLIRDAGIAAHMCTNGTLLTDERVAKLAQSSLKSVSISIDSSTPWLHDQLRGMDGAFQQTVAGISRLRAAMPGLRINVNCTISKINVGTIGELVSLVKDLGCDKISFAPIHTNLQHKHKPKDQFDGMVFRSDELGELQGALAEVSMQARKLRIGISSSRFLQGIPRSYVEPMRWHTCYAGYASCAISPWGEVSPCVDMDSVLNVWNAPLDKIWLSPEFQVLREKVDSCSNPCWDTTNTEIAIRFSFVGILSEVKSIIQDLTHYNRRKK